MADEDELSLAEFVTEPVATIAAVLAVISGSLSGVLEPILGTIWNQSGAIFGVFSVGASTLTQHFEWLPKRALTLAAVGAALLFVANRGWTVYQGYQKESTE